ncbi:flagellar hook-associated protein FlgK [Sedimentibacter sp.]|uniref:flagellar hook-associated protein FlgK n=1 Tax=Sedimentibacter sp. TaxID=1960295 RepID=UPI0028AF12DB|nr:flagellar hook-associated protein FlgK [Sedimentibacter sp.]
MLRSTFLGYQTATSALKVHQNFMDVVGQNMANVNTKGYTRQRLDVSSFGFTARNLKYSLDGVVIGQGVKATGISQYRDSFLDLRYRTAAAKTGDQEVQLEALIDLETFYDEIAKEGLDSQFSHLLDQLHNLTTKGPTDPVYQSVVRTSAQILTQMFNDYSTQLDTIREQQLEYLEKGATVEVNKILKNIAILNQQIREANIGGNPALELNDERNLLIDELSSYLDIEVDINKINIGGDNTVDELSINLKLSDGSKVKIVDNKEFAEFATSVPAGATDVVFELVKSIDSTYPPDDLTDKINNGQIGGYIKFLNGKGEYDTTGIANSQVKGVQYYQKLLDTLANKFATIMNELNQKPTGFDADGNVTGWELKDLFASRDGAGTDITAKSIKISDDWASATESYITNTIVKPDGNDDTGATDNILRMIDAFKEKNDFTTQFSGPGGVDLFKGTFQEFMSFAITKLNLHVDEVEKSHESYLISQYQIDYERSSLSSVDFNEEGVNLLQYSKSYNAAARLMTTLDEMLDTLINRMGV